MTLNMIFDGLAWACVVLALFSLFHINVRNSDALSWVALAGLFHWWLR
jgi:hypothetical protein